VNIELINTGTELLLGLTLNTHQQWICRTLADLGYIVSRQVTVSDTGPAIRESVREALQRADLVITTGGLGPTSDDRTREEMAALLGRKLLLDPAIEARIESFFAARNRPMPATTRIQAMVPEGAIVLSNECGTAPGLVFELERNPFRSEATPATIIMLPGPPRELRPMFLNSVVPLLQRTVASDDGGFFCRTFRTIGIGESLVEEKIAGPLGPLLAAGLELGFCAHVGAVDVRLAARGGQGKELLAQAEPILRGELGPSIFAVGDETIETSVVTLLRARHKTFAVAESCTGGLIAHRITNVPGASEVFMEGLVTYSNEAKQRLLGVRAETLIEHGAVSEPVAREMAEGARLRSRVDFAIAVTGIAGPGGGSDEKPVGTVFIALSRPDRLIAEHYLNKYDRETFKQVTAQQALNLLRRELLAS
jgi:nicotinamide-nucleotide amidase